jgi:O-acetyl-ADP-ribose deacetylase (regulator of RNase III)
MQLNYITGDASYPDKTCEGTKIICHVCNNLGAWGKGFVVSLSNRWWFLRNAYRYDMKIELGSIGCFKTEGQLSRIWVCNMIAQNGIRSKDNPVPLRHDALYICLEKLKDFIDNMPDKNKTKSIHMPRIGSGLAGGFWPEIEEIIINIFDNTNYNIYVYDLPKKQNKKTK